MGAGFFRAYPVVTPARNICLFSDRNWCIAPASSGGRWPLRRFSAILARKWGFSPNGCINRISTVFPMLSILPGNRLKRISRVQKVVHQLLD
jgi:hypothetical protein